jgi:hypothetical protein
MSVKLSVSLHFRTRGANGALLIAIWIWGLASFGTILALGTSRDLSYHLGPYCSLVERTAWVSVFVCLVAQFLIIALSY